MAHGVAEVDALQAGGGTLAVRWLLSSPTLRMHPAPGGVVAVCDLAGCLQSETRVSPDNQELRRAL